MSEEKTVDVRAVVEKVLALVKSDMPAEDITKVNENVDTIAALVTTIKDVFGKGLNVGAMSRVGELVAPLMLVAAGFKDYKGADKKRFVTEVLWLVYRVVDTYPDGKRNNIKIPFVFGFIERRVERWAITLAAGIAIDALYKRMKKDGEV
jgi:hypothetical protein